jgi:hypothetical protein
MELDVEAVTVTPRERAALRRTRLLADLLDDAVRVPGTSWRVGLDAVLGLVPVVGDGVAAALSLYVVAEAVRLGASKATIARMLVNVAVDALVGSIPVVGDLFDAAWRANSRNVDLLEREVGV